MLTFFVCASLLQDAPEPWRVEGRSLYVWEKAPPADLLRFCGEKKVARLYYMFDGKNAPVDFLRAAKAAKIQVHAMHPGDLADWLDPFPKFDHAVVVDWVRATVKLGLFDGVHLDVEPHGHELWRKHKQELGKGYLELLRLCREAAGKTPLSAALPWNWEAVEVDGKPLIARAQDALDWVSIMAYRGANAQSVISAVEGEWAYRPGRVELIVETDRAVVEDGVALHVGTEAKLEAVFAAARERFGGRLMEAVHHYGTWKTLPK
ncbi:MAG TPA: hypothetical protein VF950_13260 [Planctomycetota bacterium]